MSLIKFLYKIKEKQHQYELDWRYFVYEQNWGRLVTWTQKKWSIKKDLHGLIMFFFFDLGFTRDECQKLVLYYIEYTDLTGKTLPDINN